ncbi:hypothetical protein Dsin_018930 [Dipteronia sinensis]|uniref:Uncharacterized protein n=1 Tax=Dipteronia sinensis TaxID=43782 RepID=A0AAE0E3J7_9ROSI|nr:hypothetical protein Dsin_018930 [Dipteronia sinensis]
MCPLYYSPINASKFDMLKALQASFAVAGANGSFRVEIGSISRRLRWQRLVRTDKRFISSLHVSHSFSVFEKSENEAA